MITATRYHDFSAGHRVVGHENVCAQLHGHNYRIYFEVASINLDDVGRVLDFSVIKILLCQWLEDNWDHRFLLFAEDPWLVPLENVGLGFNGVVTVPFNPTAENMAKYLVDVVGPPQLAHTGTELVRVTVEETRKCSATYDKRLMKGGFSI